MLATMVDWRRKIKKKHLLKRPKAVPKKTRNLDQNINDSKSHICNSFFENIISRVYNFFMFIHTFQCISSESFFNFRMSSWKSQSQQKLVKKIIHFTIQFHSKHLTHLTNLSSLDIENNMLPKKRQKPFSLYKFPSKHVSCWCQKKHLHYTISWHPRTVFLKHFESKCLYISVYVFKKIFVPNA